MALASAVSLVLVFVLRGNADGIDATLPRTGPIGALIPAVVPFVWVGLFGGLGAAYALTTRPGRKPGQAGVAILLLAGLCSLCPLLASSFDFVPFAILGNGIVIWCAIVAADLCRTVSRTAAVLVTAVAIWVAMATSALVALHLGLPF